MKKFYWIISVGLFTVSTLYAQMTCPEEFIIYGTIKGVNSGYIRMLPEDGGRALDSAKISDSKFTLRGEIALPERRLFNVIPGNWNFKGIIEKGQLIFQVDTTGAFYQSNKTGKWSLIWEIEETGSSLFDAYRQYNEETGSKETSALILSLKKQMKLTNDEILSARLNTWVDSLMSKLVNAKRSWLENYIEQYPNSIAGVFLLNDFYTSRLMDTSICYWQSIQTKFLGLAKSSVYYQLLTSTISREASIQPGLVAPSFTLSTSTNNKFTLSSTRGSYVLLDFWASWCVPCRAAIPEWKKVYEINRGKAFTIVSLSGDRNRDDWQKALIKEQMPWMQIVDEYPDPNRGGLVAGLYQHATIPFYVLLNKEGVVLLTTGNEIEMAEKIVEILK